MIKLPENLMNVLKKPKTLIILGIIGIMLIFLSSLGNGKSEKRETEPQKEISVKEYKENLEKDWVHVDMDITSLSAVNLPFLAFDTLFGPEASPQDGKIDLISACINRQIRNRSWCLIIAVHERSIGIYESSDLIVLGDGGSVGTLKYLLLQHLIGKSRTAEI